MSKTMKYYKYWDEESPIDGGFTYLETDGGYAIRQITVHADRFFASNVRYPHWGLCLAEGHVNYDSIDKVTLISKNEFDEIWQKHLLQHRSQWNKAKQVCRIGSKVEGSIVIFFPQGVIIDLGDDVLGVADYKECKASTKPEFMYPKHKVTAIVEGYDKVNQWVILASPQVYEARIEEINK